nr:uncharacterized protein LOC109740514 [Aegilops tauschii subsp. strangulata]
MKKISQMNRVCSEMKMVSKDETSKSESDDEELHRSIGRSNAFIAYESSDNSLESDTDEDTSSDDEQIASCLMEKSPKDQVSTKHQKSMNGYSPEYKLVKIAKSQQDELEMLERNLRETEGLLVKEMEKNQKLIERHDAFSSTIDDLTNRYDSLSIDYESLSDELLNRNQELESLKESHNELVKEKASLFTEQSVQLPYDFVPPYLKCLEHSNADSHPETSNAIIENIAAITNGNTNPSSKEFAIITDENCRIPPKECSCSDEENEILVAHTKSLEEQSGSEEEMPQLPPLFEHKRLTAGGKASKPPKIPKKKSESESEEEEDDIPSAHSQPEDELVTDAMTLFSDGNPKKGGRGREKNITAEMSDPESYKTPAGVETTTERNNRLQRIRHHWAKK